METLRQREYCCFRLCGQLPDFPDASPHGDHVDYLVDGPLRQLLEVKRKTSPRLSFTAFDHGCVKTLGCCYDSPVILLGESMGRFVKEADRGQRTLLPECLDDFIDESSPPKLAAEDLPVERLILGRLFAIVRAALRMGLVS